MTTHSDRLDRSFTTMFIIISVFNVGVILSTVVRMGESSQAANSMAITQGMIPILLLVIIWWAAEFYDRLSLRLVGWFVLFTLVFYVGVFLLIMLGADRYIGFNVIYLVFGYILAPLPASAVTFAIKKQYCSALNRSLTKRERTTTMLLIVLFMIYWLFVPWDLKPLGISWWP